MNATALFNITAELILLSSMAALALYIHQHEPSVAYWRQLVAMELSGLLGQGIYLFAIRPMRGLPPILKTKGRFRF